MAELRFPGIVGSVQTVNDRQEAVLRAQGWNDDVAPEPEPDEPETVEPESEPDELDELPPPPQTPSGDTTPADEAPTEES